MSHEGKRLYPIQLQYLGWIMGIPEWSYPLDLPPNRGYRFPPRFSAVLSFRNPNLNLYLLASWEGGMKFQSIIYNPLKNNQASISTASNNQYQAIIYNTKLSSRSCILVVATMPFYNMLEIVITKWFFVQDMAPPPLFATLRLQKSFHPESWEFWPRYGSQHNAQHQGFDCSSCIQAGSHLPVALHHLVIHGSSVWWTKSAKFTGWYGEVLHY